MRRKSLLGLALISLLSINSYALNIQKGHLISHKEWSTGNLKFSFPDLKTLPVGYKPKAPKLGQDTDLNLYTFILPFMATVGSPISISGSDVLYVQNQSTSSQEYEYTFGICAGNSSHDYQCAYYFDQFQLDPGGYASAQQGPTISMSYDTPGTYPIFITASAHSYDSSNWVSSSNSMIQVS